MWLLRVWAGFINSHCGDSGESSCRSRQCSWKISPLKFVSGLVTLGPVSTVKLSLTPPTKAAWQHCCYSHVIPMTPSHLQLVHFYVLSPTHITCIKTSSSSPCLFIAMDTVSAWSLSDIPSCPLSISFFSVDMVPRRLLAWHAVIHHNLR